MNTNDYSDELVKYQEEQERIGQEADRINRNINSGLVPQTAEEAEEVEKGER